MSDNIIDLQQARQQLTAELRIHSDRQPAVAVCRHRRITVHEDRTKAECTDCGAPLDPHALLVQYAKRERHFRHKDEKVQAEHAKLCRQLSGLRGEERHLKKRVRLLRELRTKLEAELQQRMPSGTEYRDWIARAIEQLEEQ